MSSCLQLRLHVAFKPVPKPVCKPLPGGGLKPASKRFRRAAMRVNAKWRLTELRVCAITV